MNAALCQQKISWDAELEGNLCSKYCRFISELQRLNDVRIPHCLFTNHAVDYQVLHRYSDASELAHACVICLRLFDEDGRVQTRLVTSKSNVAPLQRQTTPHLKLLRAGILVKLIFTVNQSLINTPKLNITKSYVWTDWSAVLCWINNEKLWKQYIRSRVNKIRELSEKEQWRFCPKSQNLADLPHSRHISKWIVKEWTLASWTSISMITPWSVANNRLFR